MKIPLSDLKRQYAAIAAEADPAVLAVLHDCSYIMGDNVKAFEREFADYVGVKHAVTVGNGTDALVIALRSLGIGRGDEVITSPFTFFATGEAVAAVGATPVYCDVHEDTYNIDETKIEALITDKTKAILTVDIFGQCCRYDEISAVAKKHGLRLIDDACQAAGASYHGRKSGSLADVSCFSFFPTKNLACAGAGGAITTDDDDIALICRALKAHGSGENGQRAYNLLNGIDEKVEEDSCTDNTVYNPLKYYNYLIGYNSRTDELQAALLRVKLRHLDEFVAGRRACAEYYRKVLSGVTLPFEDDGVSHAYHQFVVKSEHRDADTARLREAGVATGVYYPVPLHLQKAFSGLGYRPGDLPVAEYLAARTFALPMFPEMTREEQDYVASALKGTL